MAFDDYLTLPLSWTTPAVHHASITPSDSVDIDPVPRALRVGSVSGGSDIVIDLLDDDDNTVTITYNGVAAGDILQIRAKRVRATGTTVTNIVAWW